MGTKDDGRGHQNRRRVKARLLGTAAGGGLPQWNCACAMCERARRHGTGRTQDCLALTGTGRRWYLVNASPDIRAQILATPELSAGPGRRETPVSGVLLTDGELDHTIGLLMLREGSPLAVYGPGPVLGALQDSFPVRPILDPYGLVTWHEVRPGAAVTLDGQLSATAIPLGVKRPRYARPEPARVPPEGPPPPRLPSAAADGTEAAGPWVVAYLFEDRQTGGSLLYAPCVAAWTGPLDSALAAASCVILDGTFFYDDEMLRATGQDRPARTMGHLPIEDTYQRLRSRPAARRLYTHLNNTNPAQADGSPERATLAAAGIEVAHDGMTLEL
jgi:pyrroloquinoline quinone biosynthesis protein B